MPEQSTEDEEEVLEGVWWAVGVSESVLREMCPAVEGKTVEKNEHLLTNSGWDAVAS